MAIIFQSSFRWIVSMVIGIIHLVLSTIDTRSLAEELSRASNKGAAATYSAIGLGYTYGHDILQRGFFNHFFNSPQPTMGSADLSAKLSIYTSQSNDELIYTFMVFGDPALKLSNFRKFIYLPLLSR